MNLLFWPSQILNFTHIPLLSLTLLFWFMSLSLQLHLGWRRRIFPLIFLHFPPFKKWTKILNKARILHNKFQQVFQSIFIRLCLGPSISSSLGNIEHPSRLITFIRDLLMKLFILQSMILHKIQKDFNEL